MYLPDLVFFTLNCIVYDQAKHSSCLDEMRKCFRFFIYMIARCSYAIKRFVSSLDLKKWTTEFFAQITLLKLYGIPGLQF